VDGRQVHFLDEFDVTYAPSARALAAARREAQVRRNGPRHLAGVGNPQPGPKPLPYARAELEEVAAFFAGESHPLYEETATKVALLEALPGASHVHLACHGLFDLENPLNSHVQLANREPLTLREIMEEEIFATAQLVALSACQSAITEFRHLPDEVIGLPAGLVQAGVPGVVGTLWPVEDLSTALVMVRFYEYYLRGDPATGEGPMSPARALRRAQYWLRTVTAGELLDYFQQHKALHEARRRAERKRMPEAVAAEGVVRFALEDAEARPFADSPYHWAPFIFVGA
jgi:CHAT domain-containing protein